MLACFLSSLRLTLWWSTAEHEHNGVNKKLSGVSHHHNQKEVTAGQRQAEVAVFLQPHVRKSLREDFVLLLESDYSEVERKWWELLRIIQFDLYELHLWHFQLLSSHSSLIVVHVHILLSTGRACQSGCIAVRSSTSLCLFMEALAESSFKYQAFFNIKHAKIMWYLYTF